MTIQRNGHIQAIRRVVNQAKKLDTTICNGIPKGLSRNQTIDALKSVIKNAEKSLDYLEKKDETC